MGTMNDTALAIIATLACLLYVGQAWEAWKRKYHDKKKRHEGTR